MGFFAMAPCLQHAFFQMLLKLFGFLKKNCFIFEICAFFGSKFEK
jgi:hypothetical protein